MAEKELYHTPAAKYPSLGKVRDIAKDLGFDISENELPEYLECLEGFMKDCTVLDQLPEPIPLVKYPRTPGYRPAPEENTHNAWYYKTDIKGCETGILAGKTIALKDNVALAGVPMMVGSRLMEGYIPEFDATIVTRILDNGGQIMGKAVCENFCLSGNSFTAATGPVLNPVNKEHSAGGSSSGSAVLVGLKEVDMAIGGDQGGSIRMPASWSGIVGLKPTYGLVPYTGISAIEPTVDHVGPMANTVKDCALLLQAISGYDDDLDPRQRAPKEAVDYISKLDSDISSLKIGLVNEGFDWCDSGVQSVVRQAVNSYMSSATIEDVSVPLHKIGHKIWGPGTLQGAYDTIICKHGIGTGQKAFYPTSMGEHMARAFVARPNDLSETMKLVCLYGEVMNRNYGTKYYTKSVNLARTLRKAYDEVLDKYDVLVMPTMTTTAPKLPESFTGPKDLVNQALDMMSNTCPFDSTGHPALTLNAGQLGGNPVGVMIIGKHDCDATVLSVAHAFEMARDSSDPITE